MGFKSGEYGAYQNVSKLLVIEHIDHFINFMSDVSFSIVLLEESESWILYKERNLLILENITIC